MSRDTYVSGHGKEEERRLDLQAELLEPALESKLRECIHPGDTAVDLGTGRGNVALLMERMVGENGSVYAVDRLPGAIRIAREKLDAAKSDVHLLQGDITRLPLTDNAVDFAYARFILMHLTGEQRDAALEEMKRIVKPGGRIMSQEPIWSKWSVDWSEAFPKFLAIATAYNEHFGKELQMGEKLSDLFKAHGLTATMSVEQEVISPSADPWLIPLYWLERSKGDIVKQNLATADGEKIDAAFIKQILTDLRRERIHLRRVMRFTPMYTAVATVEK